MDKNYTEGLFVGVTLAVLTNLFLLPVHGTNLIMLCLSLAKALHACLQPGREMHEESRRSTEGTFCVMSFL